MSDSGGLQIKVRHHHEAKPNGELQQYNGEFIASDSVKSFRMLRHSQINALVQGKDFEITDTGKIVFK